jgi:uncharacterized protein YciI
MRLEESMTNTSSLTASDAALTDLTGDHCGQELPAPQLYLIDMNPAQGRPTAPSPQIARDHLVYLHKLEVEGRLYGCGPVDSEPGASAHDLAIIAARSREEAEKIADNEPMHKAGLRRNTVQGHMINEGVACYFDRAMSRRVEALSESFDPDISTIGLSSEALAERAAGARLYLLSLEPTDKTRPAEDVQTGYDYFVWLRDNEMRAKLMSCGPSQSTQPPSPGTWGGGLGVVATSRAAVLSRS